MTKETKEKSEEGSSSTMAWVVGILIILVVLGFLIFGNQKADVKLPVKNITKQPVNDQYQNVLVTPEFEGEGDDMAYISTDDLSDSPQ